jgi:hypothetical protein
MKANSGNQTAAQEQNGNVFKKTSDAAAKSFKGILLASAIGLMALVVVFPVPAWTQAKSADEMEIQKSRIRGDKRLLVAINMELSESEGKAFWPIYEKYQKDLDKLNGRIGNLIEGYAAAYRTNALTDEKARKIVDEYVAIEKAEADLKKLYIPKLSKALPAKKVARYLQIENKIRALVKFELARNIPLVQ